MGLSLTVATQDDIPALIELATEIYGEQARPIAAEEFPTSFARVRCPLYLLVAKQGDLPVGLVGVLEDYMYIDTFCLCWVGVKEPFRNHGIGTLLVQAGIDLARTMVRRQAGSLVLVTEESNRAYYSRLGFTGNTPIHPNLGSTQPHVLLTRPIEPLRLTPAT